MVEPQSKDVIATHPISKERAAAGWAVLGLLLFGAGALSFWAEPNTGESGLALGSVALVLAYQTYRGASAIVTRTLQAVLCTLWFVLTAFHALNDLRQNPDWFYWIYAGMVVLCLYYVVKMWRRPWAEAS